MWKPQRGVAELFDLRILDPEIVNQISTKIKFLEETGHTGNVAQRLKWQLADLIEENNKKIWIQI